jgi:[ribosomal protein S5]-alanine N-acetyltransferase
VRELGEVDILNLTEYMNSNSDKKLIKNYSGERKMNIHVETHILRRPEPEDLELLYQYKNDPAILMNLCGFSFGYAKANLADWLEMHRKKTDEVIWVIAGKEDNLCVGHVGLYTIDFRIRSAEFAIMIGQQSAQGKGLGRRCTQAVTKYGFEELNLNRIQLAVLASNKRAQGLYTSMRFREEGRMRQGEYLAGQYQDVILMSLLRNEYYETK